MTGLRCTLLSMSLLLVACDRAGEAPTQRSDAAPAADKRGAVEPEANPDGADPAKPDARDSEAQPTPTPAPQTFDEHVATLTAGASPSAESEKTAWTHYKAKQWADAQRSFALASLHDRTHWKHPFNLACASAQAEDEAMTRVALTEAVRRDAAAVSAKARKDGDLARYRDAAWFEPTLRGEQPSPPTPPPSDPPAADEAAPEQPSPPPTDPGAPSSTPDALPLGVAKPVGAAELAKLKTLLEAQHGLAPFVRASLATTGAGGESVAYLVYDFSSYDACMLKGSKKSCREKLGAGGDDEDEVDRTKCTQQWFVRATLAGAGSLAKPTELEVACTISDIRLDALDLDGDGQQEIVLDVRGRASLAGFRESELLEVGRVVRILRLDGTQQFEFSVAWTATDLAPGNATAKRLLARDDNGDGHIDLIVESADFTGVSYASYDRDLWPRDANAAEEVELGPSKLVVWRYDAASDTWKR